jgi:crotonobetainyl-CoA:carnitine CoA-transferase CaiB-like acyl-CoA transferase
VRSRIPIYLEFNKAIGENALKPLEGIRVLDLTHAHAGPICTLYMAGLGAEVIKIEPPWGEMIRFFPPLVKGVSPYFAFLDRCKKGVTMDLKKPRGKEIFEKLVSKSDVVVENFSPGTMEGLGLGWDRLNELNPRIVFASISGFGQTGPWRDRRSFDPIAQASSGYMWLMKEGIEPSGPPYVAPEAIADTVPGFTALIGILSALYQRQMTGRGARIDVAQLDSMIAIQQSFSFWNLAGVTFDRAIRDAGPALHGLYMASDGYVMFSVPEGRITDRFRELVGVEELSRENIAAWTATQTVDEVVELLVRNGVPVARINDLDEIQGNEQAQARGMFLRVLDPALGEHTEPGFPLKFSGAGDLSKPAPVLGQHNTEVYSGILGLSEEEIESLRKDGTI